MQLAVQQASGKADRGGFQGAHVSDHQLMRGNLRNSKA